MQLTGKNIIEKEIIKNACVGGIQQQGVDLRVKNIYKVNDKSSGYIPEVGKTQTPGHEQANLYDEKTFILKPGYYEVEFLEGCDIPRDATL